MKTSLFGFIFLGLALNLETIEAQTATEIIRKSEANLKGESNQAEMTMQIIRPEWKRSMQLKTWSKGNDYQLVLVTSPAKDKGTASLKRKKELWSWMPSIERTIKVSASMMSQAWMGSDFTNDDLLQQSSIVQDYTHKIMKTEQVNGHDCWKIKLTPKPDAPIVWGKVVMWISKKGYHQFKTEFYDEDEYLVNTMKTSDVRKTTDGSREIPMRMEIVPAEKEGYKTVLTYKNIHFNVKLNDSFFSIQNMKRVR